MWSVEFAKNGASSFLALDTSIQNRVADKIEWLKDNFDTIQPQSLSGEFAHLNKLRVGDWRVLYDVDRESQMIWIVAVGHRSEIYDG